MVDIVYNEVKVDEAIVSETEQARSQVNAGQVSEVTAITRVINSGDAKARAFLDAGQSISSGSDTKITLRTISFDPGNNFDNVSNYRFTAPAMGDYLVTGSMVTSGLGITWFIKAIVKKNGVTDVITTTAAANANTEPTAVVADVISLDVGDYLELFGRQNSGSPVTISSIDTFMAVHLITTTS